MRAQLPFGNFPRAFCSYSKLLISNRLATFKLFGNFESLRDSLVRKCRDERHPKASPVRRPGPRNRGKSGEKIAAPGRYIVPKIEANQTVSDGSIASVVRT